MWSGEVLWSPILAWWIAKLVFLAGSSRHAAEMWEMNTQDVCNKFSLFHFFHLHQGILLKRSGNSLNKEWKKKYVTLSNDGILSYHSSVNVSQRVDGAQKDWFMLKAPLTASGWCVMAGVCLAGLHAERPREGDGPAARHSEGARETAASCCTCRGASSRAQWTRQRCAGSRGSQPR